MKTRMKIAGAALLLLVALPALAESGAHYRHRDSRCTYLGSAAMVITMQKVAGRSPQTAYKVMTGQFAHYTSMANLSNSQLKRLINNIYFKIKGYYAPSYISNVVRSTCMRRTEPTPNWKPLK